MLNNHQQQYLDEEIESDNHECIADAVFSLMEHLYDSGNAINPEDIKKHFSYLCDKLYIDKNLLREPLCVIHYKDRIISINKHTQE